MSECLRFTDENFQREVLNSELPVFVDFWGSWCPPCKMIEPIVDELARHYSGTVKVGKLNIDRNPATRSEYEISAAPTFMIFKNGQPLGKTIGSRSGKQLRKIIDAALGEPAISLREIPAVTTLKKEPILEEVR